MPKESCGLTAQALSGLCALLKGQQGPKKAKPQEGAGAKATGQKDMGAKHRPFWACQGCAYDVNFARAGACYPCGLPKGAPGTPAQAPAPPPSTAAPRASPAEQAELAVAQAELQWALQSPDERRRAELEAEAWAQVDALHKRIAALRPLGARVKSAQDRADNLRSKVAPLEEQAAALERQAAGLREERRTRRPRCGPRRRSCSGCTPKGWGRSRRLRTPGWPTTRGSSWRRAGCRS